MVSPHRIRYNNIFSNELNIPDLITCVALDSDNGEVSSYLNREAVSSESHDGRYKRIHSFKYTETFAPKFTFMKSNFGDFTMDEVRTVLKWITSKDTTALLEAYYDDSNVVSWASIGGFVEPQTYKLANNRTIAITATWDSISPFALSDPPPITKTVTDLTDNKITIEIHTDDNKPVYPRIIVKHNGSYVVRIPSNTNYTSSLEMNADGKVENTAYFNGTTYYWMSEEVTSSSKRPDYNWDMVTVVGNYTGKESIKRNKIYYYTNDALYYWIDPYHFHKSDASSPPNLATTSVRFTNTHTDLLNNVKVLNSTVIKNNNITEVITIDGANKIISSDSRSIPFDDDFNWTWLPLLDGTNEIAVEGNCTVTISYREPRKVGEY